MSEAIKKRMEKLKGEKNLSGFQHTQLLCLDTIMDSLVSIADSLKTINYGISKTINKKWTDDKKEED